MQHRLEVDIERQRRVQLEEMLEEVLATFLAAEVTEESIPPWVAVLSAKVDAVLQQQQGESSTGDSR